MSAPTDTGPAVLDEDVNGVCVVTTGTLVKPLQPPSIVSSYSENEMEKEGQRLKCVTGFTFTIRGFLCSVHSTIT